MKIWKCENERSVRLRMNMENMSMRKSAPSDWRYPGGRKNLAELSRAGGRTQDGVKIKTDSDPGFFY